MGFTETVDLPEPTEPVTEDTEGADANAAADNAEANESVDDATEESDADALDAEAPHEGE